MVGSQWLGERAGVHLIELGAWHTLSLLQPSPARFSSPGVRLRLHLAPAGLILAGSCGVALCAVVLCFLSSLDSLGVKLKG